MKKSFLVVLLFLTGNLIFAQNGKIVKLLNKQLQREYTKFYDETGRKKFTVTEPFQIDENNVLHFGFTLLTNIKGEKTIVSRQVLLDKIVLFDKDQNVYFYTLNKDVIETKTDYDSNGAVVRTTRGNTHYFFTEINRENYPVRFMKKIKKALTKAGYDVECNF
ncbi:hypothetical protein [Soonwooa sp.]|uniref:hypothetical protein n=1 Tax=Soonwooa sp. TaxID=1938592 RepID=UPI0028A8CBA0|nr:hypothetical protein [Soonwooa sp.]